MEILPPHLPKKEKRSASTAPSSSIFYFLSCALISIAASLATIFVSLSWLIPRAIPEVRFYTFEHQKNNPVVEAIDSNVQTRIEERQVKLYDKRHQIGGSWYGVGSELSEGILLTSDGWVVFPYLPSEVVDKKYFEIVDNKGIAYPALSVFFDRVQDLTYIKVNGTGFRFISFPQWNDINVDSFVVLQNGLKYDGSVIANIQRNNRVEASSEIWKPQFIYTLDNPESGAVFTSQGELLGFSRGGNLTAGWYIESALHSLLSNQTLAYSAFSWKGESIERGLQNGFVKAVSGFFVNENALDKSGIKAKDVIIKIQNQEFNPVTLSRVLLTSPESVTLEILRDGKSLELTLSKQIIN